MIFRDFTLLVTCFNKQDFIPAFCSNVTTFLDNGARLVIVDDGSSDKSVELLAHIDRSYANCLLIQTSNRGSAAARNLCLENLDTEFFMFWDIDDGLISEGVFEVLEKFREASADFAVSNYVTVPENRLGQMPRSFSKSTIIDISDAPKEILTAMGYWRYIYKKSIVRDNLKMRFVPDRSEIENTSFILDDLFWIMEIALQKRSTVMMTPPETVTYQYHTSSTQNSTSWSRYENQVVDLPLALAVFEDYICIKNGSKTTARLRLYSDMLIDHFQYLSFGKKLKFLARFSTSSTANTVLFILFIILLPRLLLSYTISLIRILGSTAKKLVTGSIR